MGFYINSVADSNLVFDSDFSPKNAIFTNSSSLTTTETKIKPSDGAAADIFGQSVALGSGRIVVGSYGDDDNGSYSGSAYIFDLDGTQLAKIKASDGAGNDQFGKSVAVGSGRIVVGAYGDSDNGPQSGSAYIFDLDGTQVAKIKPSVGGPVNRFGWSVAVGSGRIVVGAYANDDDGPGSGNAYLFDLDGNQLAKIDASDNASFDFFGYAVAVGSDRICVGAYRDGDNGSYSGSAYIFDLDGTQLAKIKPSDGATQDRFGFSVAIGSGKIVVGAKTADVNSVNGSGAAYIFDLDGTQLAKIAASDGATADNFGSSVAVGSGRIVAGSSGDDDNGLASGSAYIFDLDGTQLAKIDASDGATVDYFGDSVAVGSGRIVAGARFDSDNGSDSGSAYIYNIGPGKDIDYSEYIEDVLSGVITQYTRL
jgi:hypothetical protein